LAAGPAAGDRVVSAARHGVTALPLPKDAELAGLASLLDAQWFARATAARLLPPDSAPKACVPTYVRYKPGTNAIAVYSLTVPGLATPLLVQGKCLAAADYANARDKALATTWTEPTVGRPLAVCDDERILLLAFPNDPVLEGARHAANPKRMQRTIQELVSGLEAERFRVSDSRLVITPIRFKPEKRAVLRLDTRTVERATGERRPLRLYLRVDADGRGERDRAVLDHVHRGLAGHPLVGSPRPAGYDPDRRLLIVEDAGGEPVSGARNARAMGVALAALHRLPTPPLACRTFETHLLAARETAALLAALDPQLGQSATDVLDAIAGRAEAVPESPAFAHGDCHPGQVLVAGERIVLLDFDRSHVGDAAADLGNYLAQLDLAALATGSRLTTITPAAAGAELLAAYVDAGGRRPEARQLSPWRALGLVQQATAPFRELDPAWPKRAAAVLARAREVLR